MPGAFSLSVVLLSTKEKEQRNFIEKYKQDLYLKHSPEAH
jgi:hypothetical protein